MTRSIVKLLIYDKRSSGNNGPCYFWISLEGLYVRVSSTLQTRIYNKLRLKL